MKTRVGFVSNSSSTSFVVINTRNGYDTPPWGIVLTVDHRLGEVEFGWGPDKLRGNGDRVIFAYLQALYDGSPEYISMLEQVIMSNTQVKAIDWKVVIDSYTSSDYGYIDHQSVGGENLEIFNDADTLRDFLFGKGSLIVLDNDNH